MATASSLLRLSPPLTYTRGRQNHTTLFYSKPHLKSNLFNFQIAIKYKQSNSGPCQIWKNSFDQIAIQIKKTLDSLKKPAMATVLLGLLLFYDPNSAFAASGGKIGVRGTRLRTIDRLRSVEVGLLGLGRTFNRLAENDDTSTSEGLSYVLTEATLALLRYPDYCISCNSSIDGKFDEETLVNVNSVKRQSSKIWTASCFSNEYIVGHLKIHTAEENWLVPRNKIVIRAVEVLWTPQNEKDTLSEKELLEDYPLLRLL
ncbi:BnaAnng12980D [Brassica napus]|uniref:BnaAnng12980D protein n=1 Tax=Brassica napus TaxID=3708 RepID=A0A078IXK6_BRANA|nr:BnaAnng12980D [Brassica napus]